MEFLYVDDGFYDLEEDRNIDVAKLIYDIMNPRWSFLSDEKIEVVSFLTVSHEHGA